MPLLSDNSWGGGFQGGSNRPSFDWQAGPTTQTPWGRGFGFGSQNSGLGFQPPSWGRPTMTYQPRPGQGPRFINLSQLDPLKRQQYWDKYGRKPRLAPSSGGSLDAYIIPSLPWPHPTNQPTQGPRPDPIGRPKIGPFDIWPQPGAGEIAATRARQLTLQQLLG